MQCSKKSESQIYDLTVVEVIFKLGGDNLEYFWTEVVNLFIFFSFSHQKSVEGTASCV